MEAALMIGGMVLGVLVVIACAGFYAFLIWVLGSIFWGGTHGR